MGKELLVAGIETSCDETAVAVLRGTRILSSLVASQDAAHAPFGGVVPELAARRHLEVLPVLWDGALGRAGVNAAELDGIAVTRGPGLAGSLLAGVSFARGLARSLGKPLVGINHVRAHLAAAMLLPEPPQLPCLGLIVSGGHTELLWMRDWERMERLGQTLDDAAGEALDKGARLLGLGYPGGALLEELAHLGNPKAQRFTVPLAKDHSCNFSFSGIKTALMLKVRGMSASELEAVRADLAAAYQAVVVKHLVQRTVRAAESISATSVVAAGGVLANGLLRSELANVFGDRLFIPPRELCGDNGAMAAALGSLRLARGEDDGAEMTVAVNWGADWREEPEVER
jgi:N6-L-threonylcarbamoyladenine synthase